MLLMNKKKKTQERKKVRSKNIKNHIHMYFAATKLIRKNYYKKKYYQ